MSDRTFRSQTDYDVVRYRPGFRRQIFALQRHLWGHELDPDVYAEYLDWKYARNPYVHTPLIYVGVRSGEVVGMRGFYGAKWSMGRPPEQLVSLCGADLVVAPEHRRRGVFRKLTRAALEDAGRRGYTYAFSLNPGVATSVGLAAMGWRAVGSVEPMLWESKRRRVARRVREGMTWGDVPAKSVWRYAKRLRVAREARQLVRRLFVARRETRRREFGRLDAEGAVLARSSGSRVRLSRTPEPEAMADLVGRIGTDGRICHVRDSEYFAWRFGNPLSRYRFIFWNDGGRLDGYLVLQRSIFPGKTETNIVDWEASRASVRAELLRAAMECGGFGELRVWSATLSDDARALLRDAGFRPTAEVVGAASERRILVRSVRDDMLEKEWVLGGRRLLEIADWDLRMIDSDAY